MSTKPQTLRAALPSGESVFYRSAGSSKNPTILLLHGFPSSSHQYRDLIPILATNYHVVAPDFPGFGFTVVPTNYEYTFQGLATTISVFLKAINIHRFSVYIFDYGAPVFWRLITSYTTDFHVDAIISQNGNLYLEGLGAFWDPIKRAWSYPSIGEIPKEQVDALKAGLLTIDATKWQYTNGAPDVALVAPESYTLDQALLDREGSKQIQVQLLFDYRENVGLYSGWQAWLKASDVPVLAVWGKNDAIFVRAGAEAFVKDVSSENLEVVLLDAGHFAVETQTEEIGQRIIKFLADRGL